MAKRNIWSHEETVTMIDIIKEKECLKHFDGKRYRNSDIFNMVQAEMEAKGFFNKSAKQIAVKWRNLKSDYMAEKRKINQNESEKVESIFYEEMDQLLGCRPSVKTFNEGIDTSRYESVISLGEHNGEPFCSISLTPGIETVDGNGLLLVDNSTKPCKRGGRKGIIKRQDPLYSRLQKISKEMNDTFFENQKQLIDYEMKLHAEMEEKFKNDFEKMMERNTSVFFNRLEQMFARGNTENESFTSNEPNLNRSSFKPETY